MKKSITILVSSLAGAVLGAIITMIVVLNVAPSMMILEDQSNFGFDETVELFTQSIADHNWKVPAVHDLQKTMKKYNMDVNPVQVFELCHPDHAGKILKASEERIVSSLMPCRVAIYQKDDGKTYVSRMNSGVMAGMMGGLIAEVMKDAASENEAILQAVID